jgi:hypothetical protein
VPGFDEETALLNFENWQEMFNFIDAANNKNIHSRRKWHFLPILLVSST